MYGQGHAPLSGRPRHRELLPIFDVEGPYLSRPTSIGSPRTADWSGRLPPLAP